MQTLTKLLIDQELNNRILLDDQLSRLIEGSKQRRYHLVNRAVKADELVKLHKGVYVMDAKFRDYDCHPYALAQYLVAGSYVSLEAALAFHGWIPEAVYETACITPKRKSKAFICEPFGRFTFYPLAINKGYFLEQVERVQVNHQTMLVAKPIRALMDLVCYRKLEWQGLSWLESSLRIDHEYLRRVTSVDMRSLKLVYKHKRMQTFLTELELALGLVLAMDIRDTE